MYCGGRVHDLVRRLPHPPGDDPGDPGQDLDDEVGVGPHELPDGFPGDGEDDGVAHRPGGGPVRVIVH